MFWLPPVRFSTTTGWFQAPCRPWASARAMVSGDPPGVSGTMIRIGRSGKPCARPSDVNMIRNPVTSQRAMGASSFCCKAAVLFSCAVVPRIGICKLAREDYDGQRPIQRRSETVLTEEELAKLQGAETLFPSPIPVQVSSSDEYMPPPQSAQQKEFEARIKESGASLAKKLGMSRRKFLQTSSGMAAAFVAMNEVYAKGTQPIFAVEKNEATSLDVAQARSDGLKNQFVMDMHTHFLREGTPIRAFVAQREAV